MSRKTVFTSVGGKLEALKLAIDWAIVGDDEPVPLLQRPHVQAGLVEPDARRILTDYARNLREVHSRIAPLDAVVQAASGLEPELRALAERRPSATIAWHASAGPGAGGPGRSQAASDGLGGGRHPVGVQRPGFVPAARGRASLGKRTLRAVVGRDARQRPDLGGLQATKKGRRFPAARAHREVSSAAR